MIGDMIEAVVALAMSPLVVWLACVAGLVVGGVVIADAIIRGKE